MNLKMKTEREILAVRLEVVRNEIHDRNQELIRLGRKPGGGESFPSRIVKLSKELENLQEEQAALAQELELYDSLLRLQEKKKVKV